MSALVDVREQTARHSYLGLDLAPGITGKNVARNLGYRLSGVNATYLTGQKAGEPIEGTLVKANQIIQLNFGTVSPARYEALVTYNPVLTNYANVVTAPIISHGDGAQPLIVTLIAFKQFDLAEVPWFVTLHLVD
jgi:hypothetical protein